LQDALGAAIFNLVELVAVEDLSWAVIGRRVRCDPKTARSWAIAAIRALVAH
jgi:hypothetical protein